CSRDRGNPDWSWLLATRRIRPLIDRQHSARRLRSPWNTNRRPCERDRPRSVPAGCDGWAATAVFLFDRPILADLGFRGFQGNEGDLAGNSCDRRILCHPAIPDFQLHQSVDCRYRRFIDLNGLPDRVPASLATKRDLDLAGSSQPRRLCRHNEQEAAEIDEETDNRRGLG